MLVKTGLKVELIIRWNRAQVCLKSESPVFVLLKDHQELHAALFIGHSAHEKYSDEVFLTLIVYI